MTITSHGKLLTLMMLATKGKLFVPSAALASELQLTQPWLLISLDSSDPEIAQIAMTLSAILDGFGPGEYQQFAAAILGGVQPRRGHDRWRLAHHVRALVDPKESAAALDLTVPPPSSTESSTSSGGPASVQVDVWLDELGRVVTTTTRQALADQQMTSTNHVTRFNRPVTITAPDPADFAAF